MLSCKISDLGLARHLKHGAMAKTKVGTIEYTAPNMYTNAGVTHAFDIYSLGCTVFYMLTGYPPFDNHMSQVLAGNFIFPKTVRVSLTMLRLVCQMM